MLATHVLSRYHGIAIQCDGGCHDACTGRVGAQTLMAARFRVLYVLAITAFLLDPIAKSQVTSPASGTGFCVDGVASGTHWPGQKPPANVTIWGSFCKNGDNDFGRVESEPFPAPAVLSLYLAGYPGQLCRDSSCFHPSFLPTDLPPGSVRTGFGPVPDGRSASAIKDSLPGGRFVSWGMQIQGGRHPGR